MASAKEASNISPQPFLVAPSHQLLAFAVAVIESKPKDLTVRKYIAALQQHVAKGRRENRISSVYRHLDQSSFWRAEFKRVKSLCDTKDRELIDQRRRNESLKRKIDVLEPGLAKKHKKTNEDTIPEPARTPKTDEVNGRLEEDVEQVFELGAVGESGHELVQSLYLIHTALREVENQMGLASHLVRAASIIPKVVQQSIAPKSVTLDNSRTDTLLLTLRAVTRAVSSLILGLDRMSSVTDDETTLGQVMYEFANMFAALLRTMDVALVHERNKLSQDEPSQKKRGRKAVYSGVVNALTNFLRGLIDLLDPGNDIHNALFEAFAYAIVNKVGTQLYLFVFDHARKESIEKDILTPHVSDEITDAPENTGMNIATLEAYYLVYLLKHIMTAAPAHLDTTSNTNAKTEKSKTTGKKSAKGVLTSAAKDRLQNTLLSCMFGNEDGKAHDDFEDRLRMPVLCSVKLPGPTKPKHTDMKEWFKERVWALLGWEILGRNEGF